MSCSEFHSQVQAYHDGELSPERVGQFDAHLPSCASCTAELAALRTMSNLLATNVPIIEMPVDMLGRLHDHVDRTIENYGDSNLLPLARSLAGLAAAVLIVASAGLWKLQPEPASAPQPWEGTLMSSSQNDSAQSSGASSDGLDPELILADLSRKSMR